MENESKKEDSKRKQNENNNSNEDSNDENLKDNKGTIENNNSNEENLKDNKRKIENDDSNEDSNDENIKDNKRKIDNFENDDSNENSNDENVKDNKRKIENDDSNEDSDEENVKDNKRKIENDDSNEDSDEENVKDNMGTLEDIENNEDSEHETESKLKFIERKNEKPEENKEDKHPLEVENEEEKAEKQKSVAHEMQLAMKEPTEEDDPDGTGTFFERNLKEKVYSVWSLDFWFRDYFSEMNQFIVAIMEIFILSFLIFLIPSYWIIKNWKDIKFADFFKPLDTINFTDYKFILRFLLFTLIWYSFDLIVMLICENFVFLVNFILISLQLGESEIIWGIVANIYSLRLHLRVAITCFFVFHLSINMFLPFQKPDSFDLSNVSTYNALILWYAFYSILNFSAMLLLSYFVYDIKQSSYKEAIWDLNYKIFIFKKLLEIGNSKTHENQVEDDPSFDPGFYLKDNDFFLSEDDAKIVSNNILVGLKKHRLEYEDIKKYFPKDYKKVYYYFSEVEAKDSENPCITSVAFKKRARDLYIKRKDMSRTLIDRDYIFDMLEYLVWLVVVYISAIVLCLFFKINYTLYFFGVGSSLLTVSWVFADTIKKIFICFVFVLLIRPYDIGDKVEIDEEILKVYKVNLLHTTFLNQNRSITYLSNDVLFNTKIINYARSPSQSVEIEITPDSIVTLERAKKIEEVADEKVKEKSKYFSSVELIEKTDSKIKYMIYLKKNLQEDALVKKRKRLLMSIFDDVLSEVGISHKSSYIFNP